MDGPTDIAVPTECCQGRRKKQSGDEKDRRQGEFAEYKVLPGHGDNGPSVAKGIRRNRLVNHSRSSALGKLLARRSVLCTLSAIRPKNKQVIHVDKI